MYACMYVCMYACNYVCMYVCMYVCKCVSYAAMYVAAQRVIIAREDAAPPDFGHHKSLQLWKLNTDCSFS